MPSAPSSRWSSPTRTLVTITELSWQPSPDGAKAAFGNCEGWAGMLAALKVWLEHGSNLRRTSIAD